MTAAEMVDQTMTRLGVTDEDSRLRAMYLAQLNAEYRTIFCMQPWRWREALATIALTASSEWLALPADFGIMKYVKLASNGTPLPVADMDAKAMNRGDVRYRARSTPESYYIVAGQMITDPLPAGADTLDIVYFKGWTESGAGYTKLIADTDEPIFPNEFHQILPERAIAKLAAVNGLSDVMAGMARSDAKEIYHAMLKAETRSMPTTQNAQTPGVYW